MKRNVLTSMNKDGYPKRFCTQQERAYYPGLKKMPLLFFMLLFTLANVFSQVNITGKVTDIHGAPVPGANVSVKGTTGGVVTSVDGSYALQNISKEDILVFSFIGMLTEEVPVGDQTMINITMIEDLLGLDEVVVIGYGSVKKRDLTGAVSSVRSEEITMAPVTNTIEALQGRVAGLDIARSNGGASSGMNILLRGNRSIPKNEDDDPGDEPIYIIDGIQGSISNLNPNDIISIDVLKDASSTAIYGSKGANGVIMITTKKAEKGQMQVEFSSYVSINDNPVFPSPLQGDAWFRYLEESYNATYPDVPTDREGVLNAWGFNPDILDPYIDSAKWINWMDETFQRGIQHNSNLSIRSGNEIVQSSFSLGYNKTQGIYKNDYQDKFTLRENLNINAAKWVNFGIITGLTYQNRESRSSRVNKAFGMVPLGEVYDINGDINPYPIEEMTDVISVLADNIDGAYRNNRKSLDITANPYVEITPLNGLSFKSLLGSSLSSSRQGIFNSDHTYMILSGSQPPIKYSAYATGLGYGYTWENILDYKRSIAVFHNVGATFVTSYENTQSEGSDSYSEDFLYDDYLFFNLDAGLNQRSNTRYSVGKQMSYAGRLNYDYMGKYYLTGSVRYDGVSQLAKTWDMFSSGAIAWRISEESFMTWSENWLSNLKLRTGYGVAGSDNISAYKSTTEVTNGIDEINLGGGQLQTVIPTQSITNLDLSWEKTYSLNIGLDFGLYGGRVDGSVDWYDQDSRGIIYDRALPFSLGGFGPKLPYTLAANVANLHNKGIEITLNTWNIQSKNFQWNSTLTFSRNWNEITSIDLGSGKTAEDLISEGIFIGSPLHVHYDYKKTGIWQIADTADAAVFGLLPGDVKIESSLTKDSDGVWFKTITNEDGSDTTIYYSADNPYAINESEDRQVLGQREPKWIAGFQNTFAYKGFDLNIFVTARWGHMIDGELLGYFQYGNNNIPDNYDYWTETNPTNDYPRPYLSSRPTPVSDPLGGNALRYVDASYIKVKNITLGYTLPASLMNKANITNLRVYSTVYNTFIFTKSHLLDGIDPETGASDSFPLYKQLVFGINVSF